MKLILAIAGFFTALSDCFAELSLGNLENDNTDLSAIKIIEKYGYPAESHLIETEDGYFLQLHRIPHGKNSTSTSSKKSILMSHGLITSSNSFLMLGPNSLPFLAADRGYDVWLGNLRGNHYAKLHRSLSSKGTEFWDFSFHEMGFYDVPAQIDYICNYTKRNNVTLLGMSLGATVQLITASTRPDYQKKVRAAVLLGTPSIFIRHKAFFLQFAPLYPLVYSKSVTNTEILGENLIRRYLHIILGMLSDRDVTNSRNFHQLSQNTGIRDFKDVWFLLRFYPSSSSLKACTHYFQQAFSGKFQQYDYGPTENLIKYKSREPPEYNLESITIPMSLIFSADDLNAGAEDEHYLLNRLKTVKSVLKIKDKGFRHMDFAIRKNVKELVYDKVLDLMENL